MTEENYNINEEIDQYLKGELSEEDSLLFERKMNSDKELAQMVNAQRAVNNMIITKELNVLKAKMQKDLSQPGKLSINYPFLFVGSAILISTVVFFYNNFNENRKQLSADKIEIISSSENVDFDIDDVPALPSEINKSAGKKSFSVSDAKAESEKVTFNEIVPESIEEIRIAENAIISEPEKTSGIDKENVNLPENPVKDCSLENLDLAIEINDACRGKNNGSIHINYTRFNAGQKPFEFSIDNGKTFSKSSLFSNLSPGIYHVVIRDSKLCTSKFSKQLSEKACAEALNYAFNPGLENLKVKIKNHSSGIIMIYNVGGNLVYSNDFTGDDYFQWDGKDKDGQTLQPGYFAFSIKYNDGEEQNGFISITY
ncbi:MAG: gliding motility-associated C-terminal domain-containing protein [Cytophagaceae bacterium]